jgi:3-oxoacyl-[acyl-carrier-protein] synthase-3
MNREVISEQGQLCLQALIRVWFDFERNLGKVPIVQRLEQGRISLEDYRNLLLNMRQQVIEGSRWISRSASSFDRDFADVRSEIISHAVDEHKDYEILEQDYVNAGGDLADIQNAQRNIGSEALHGFLMYRATLGNPVDMIGAMWIIEGLGNKMALSWAQRIAEVFGKEKQIAEFMNYHGENDEQHLNKLYRVIDRVCQSEEDTAAIVRTAKVVARLYLLQLEEVDNV